MRTGTVPKIAHLSFLFIFSAILLPAPSPAQDNKANGAAVNDIDPKLQKRVEKAIEKCRDALVKILTKQDVDGGYYSAMLSYALWCSGLPENHSDVDDISEQWLKRSFWPSEHTIQTAWVAIYQSQQKMTIERYAFLAMLGRAILDAQHPKTGQFLYHINLGEGEITKESQAYKDQVLAIGNEAKKFVDENKGKKQNQTMYFDLQHTNFKDMDQYDHSMDVQYQTMALLAISRASLEVEGVKFGIRIPARSIKLGIDYILSTQHPDGAWYMWKRPDPKSGFFESMARGASAGISALICLFNCLDEAANADVKDRVKVAIDKARGFLKEYNVLDRSATVLYASLDPERVKAQGGNRKPGELIEKGFEFSNSYAHLYSLDRAAVWLGEKSFYTGSNDYLSDIVNHILKRQKDNGFFKLLDSETDVKTTDTYFLREQTYALLVLTRSISKLKSDLLIPTLDGKK